jgi:hypothetical protein
MSQSTQKPLRYDGRGTAATTAEAKAREPAARGARGVDRLERAHQSRPAVLAGSEALRDAEPSTGDDQHG